MRICNYQQLVYFNICFYEIAIDIYWQAFRFVGRVHSRKVIRFNRIIDIIIV